MEILISGRNVEVPEHFRDHVTEKLIRLERYDHKITRLSVELTHEPNPRRAKSCQCVQITGRGRGPVVRGEGCAGDFLSAVDLALGRLESRLRRAHDRRRVHHGRRQPISVARALGALGVAGPEAGAVAVLDPEDAPAGATVGATVGAPVASHASTVGGPGPSTTVPSARSPLDDDRTEAADGADAGPGTIARRKEHPAVPMSVDEALSQMELVGHDFFLFSDAASGRPSVVYRRRGYDYGVIALVAP